MASTKKTRKHMMTFSTVQDVYNALNEGYKISDKVNYSDPKKTKGKAVKLSLGRIWFNLLLPDEFPLINDQVNNEKLNDIIKEISQKYAPDVSADITTEINREAFELSSRIPSSFDIDSLILPTSIKEKKKKLNENTDNIDIVDYGKDVVKISEEYLNIMDEKDQRLSDIIKGGIKGDKSMWGSIMISQGHVMDIEGKVLGPIKSATADGLTPKEFYQAAAEARRGFFYKAAISAEPGYLARRVSMAGAGTIINDKKKDCGTKKTFALHVTSKISKLIEGRYYIEGRKKILIENPKDVVGKTIKMRSPLYCKSKKGICPTCYGDTYKTIGTNNIGILSGGAVNKAALNAYMKMRHQSTKVEMIKVNFIKDLKKAALNTPEINRYFTITETQIIANEECYIIIDSDDYNEQLLIEAKDYYLIPGIINITINKEPNFPVISFPFNHQVKLYKPVELEEEKKVKTLNYVPGEKIMEQDYYQSSADVGLINQMFEGRTKYVTKPDILVMSLHDQMTGIDLIHFETIVQNMFRDSMDITKPARLSDYNKFEIKGQKELPFIINWLTALSFENPKKAIKRGLLSGMESDMNPLNKIVSDQFSKEEDQ